MTAPHIRRSTKLSDEQVVEALRLYHEEGWSQGRIARQLKVTAGTIGRYVRGESRQDVVDNAAIFDPNAPAPTDSAINESLSKLTHLIEAPPVVEEDPIDAILRRRGAPIVTQEKTDEPVEQKDGERSSEAPQDSGVRTSDH